MGSKRREPTFAEVVQAVRATTAAPSEPPRGQLVGHDRLVDPTGREFTRVAHDISPAAALAAAAGGAQVVWDACGCDGYCGLEWLDDAQVARLVASGAPKARRRRDPVSHLSAWVADDGSVVLVAVADVRWGDVLA